MTIAPESTSIRVDVRTRDTLARLATHEGLSLNGYLGRMAEREWKAYAIAEFRASESAALLDPSYAAELAEWEAAETGDVVDEDGENWWE